MTEDAFKFSKSILQTKEYQTDIENYNPFFNNKILSQHIDCLLHVNAMNCFYQQLTPKQQYDYYFYTIRPMKRKFNKWGKKNEDKTIELIMKYYDYSYRRAVEVVDLFNKEQIKYMEKEMDIGG